jgi:glycine/D-amino acid oxidase-like deaminating enzyme
VSPTTYDTVIVGAGVVGSSIAWGLAQTGERVCLLDEGDDAFRAARGNFGLVWVQGKGAGRPAYARWTIAAAAAWPTFARRLHEQTGIDVELQQRGGLYIGLNEEEIAKRTATLCTLRDQVGLAYPFEVLGASELRRLVPQAGPAVAGAVWHALDGHVSPLRLLRALHQAYVSAGGVLQAGAQVQYIESRNGGFRVDAGGYQVASEKLVLAAGLGNGKLAPLVGLTAPVAPIRGQILVTERLNPFLEYPTLHVRQTGEGVIQIGDSKEDVGFDDGTTLRELSRIAARAVRCFPLLATVNVVRTWGALRVMSADTFPIYEASPSCPGAFVATCHSGITLAPQHGVALVDWIRGGEMPEDIRQFNGRRFDAVQVR